MQKCCIIAGVGCGIPEWASPVMNPATGTQHHGKVCWKKIILDSPPMCGSGLVASSCTEPVRVIHDCFAIGLWVDRYKMETKLVTANLFLVVVGARRPRTHTCTSALPSRLSKPRRATNNVPAWQAQPSSAKKGYLWSLYVSLLGLGISKMCIAFTFAPRRGNSEERREPKHDD